MKRTIMTFLALVAATAAAFAADQPRIEDLGEFDILTTTLPGELSTLGDVDVRLRPIRAPGARTWIVDSHGRHDAALSGHRYYSVHKDGRLETIVRLLDGVPVDVRTIDAGAAAPEQKIDLDCAVAGRDLSVPVYDVAPPMNARLSGHTYEVTVAFDTDSQLLSNRFANSTTAADTYIDDLVAAMTVFYERDLSTRILKGDTFLRVGTDPYLEPGNDTAASLDEFGAYWAANMGGVDRTFAAMLSGRGSSFSFSGIAWLDGWCETQSTGGGYSFQTIFWGQFGGELAANANGIGHEIGHNMGSNHTHCYVPPIDQCFNGQAGCYPGPESCPAGPGSAGTIMSYCHLSTAGCASSNQDAFHPTVIANLNGFLSAHAQECSLISGAVFADSFETGDTSAWN